MGLFGSYAFLLFLSLHTALLQTTTATNTTASDPLLILLIDSLRWDLLSEYESRTHLTLPGFTKLKELGAHVERVSPVFPAECYPNLMTLFTGLYPKDHGVTFTQTYDSSRGQAVDYDLIGPSNSMLGHMLQSSLFRGRKVHMYNLPICRTDPSSNVQCDAYEPKKMNFSHLSDALDRAVHELATRSVDISIIYYDGLDYLGHQYGPLSDEVLLKHLPDLDSVLLNFIQDRLISPTGPSSRIHFVLTADHGMSTIVGRDHLDRYLSKSKVKFVLNRGSTVSIWPRTEHYIEVVRRLNTSRTNFALYHNSSSHPASWYSEARVVGTDGPFPPVLLVAKPGYVMQSDFWPIQLSHYGPSVAVQFNGAHGYDPIHMDMHVPLFAVGPLIRPQTLFSQPNLDHSHVHRLFATLVNSTRPAVDTHNLYGQLLLVRGDGGGGHVFHVPIAIVAVLSLLGLILIFCGGLLFVYQSRLRWINPKFVELEERLLYSDSVAT